MLNPFFEARFRGVSPPLSLLRFTASSKVILFKGTGLGVDISGFDEEVATCLACFGASVNEVRLLISVFRVEIWAFAERPRFLVVCSRLSENKACLLLPLEPLLEGLLAWSKASAIDDSVSEVSCWSSHPSNKSSVPCFRKASSCSGVFKVDTVGSRDVMACCGGFGTLRVGDDGFEDLLFAFENVEDRRA